MGGRETLPSEGVAHPHQALPPPNPIVISRDFGIGAGRMG